MPPRSRLSDQDRADWAAYARHVRLLPGAAPISEPTPAPPPSTPPPSTPSPAAPHLAAPTPRQPGPARRPAPLVTGEQPAGLDRATWTRFRTGRMAAVRTLDLHGKTAQAAYHALTQFLHAAHAGQIRCVEIITGRGSGEHGGVIRRELPHWLNQPALRHLILAASHPHALNPGSTRLLLRKSAAPRR
jgi:DNA-nicking Smr family endonuclease